jgi:IS1 family transposase
MDLAVKIITLLCEGMPVRGVSRVTGVDVHTVIDLCNVVGTRCEEWMAQKIKGVRVIEVQADEIWQYIYCKHATAVRKKLVGGVGDSYCFTAIERGSKLLLTWHMGRRSDMDTAQFCEKLADATSGRFHLSTDGWQPYPYWVRRFLGGRVDYGTIVKIFRDPVKEDRRRYSPPTIIGQKKTVILGEPEHSQVCTSHVERMNGSIRHFCKRMGRLTYCFSKRWGNHRAALGLMFAHYNLCRKHRSLKGRTPAMAHGLVDHVWSVRELLENVMNQGSALQVSGVK